MVERGGITESYFQIVSDKCERRKKVLTFDHYGQICCFHVRVSRMMLMLKPFSVHPCIHGIAKRFNLFLCVQNVNTDK